MILKYSEGLHNAINKEWFKSFYKEDDLASDSEVDLINEKVKKVGEKYLFEYFDIKEDMILQKEYVEDLIEYLEDIEKELNV